MRITPIDIHQKDFRRAIRGYNEEEVDTFLDEVAKEMERLFQENIDLTEKVERLEKRVAQYQSFEQALQETMLTAQNSADELKKNAGKAAELIIKDAQMKAEQIKRQILIEREKVKAEIVMLKKISEDFKLRFLQFLKQQSETVSRVENLTSSLPSFEELEEKLFKKEKAEEGEVYIEEELKKTQPAVKVVEEENAEEDVKEVEAEEEEEGKDEEKT